MLSPFSPHSHLDWKAKCGGKAGLQLLPFCSGLRKSLHVSSFSGKNVWGAAVQTTYPISCFFLPAIYDLAPKLWICPQSNDESKTVAEHKQSWRGYPHKGAVLGLLSPWCEQNCLNTDFCSVIPLSQLWYKSIFLFLYAFCYEWMKIKVSALLPRVKEGWSLGHLLSQRQKLMCNMCSYVYSSRKDSADSASTPAHSCAWIRPPPRGPRARPCHWRAWHHGPGPTNGRHGCPQMSAQWAWEGRGWTGGRKRSHLPALVLRGGPGRSGAAVFPAQQVRTLIGSDTDVQNCQGASASLLSGVVPANAPPSPLTSQAPGVPVCFLPCTISCSHLRAHMHTHTQIVILAKEGCCRVLPKAN